MILTTTCGRTIHLDDEDWALLPSAIWRARTSPQSKHYAIATLRSGDVRMHRLILARELAESPTGTQVDHINGDGLDNRRVNLRLCTASENSCNRKLSAASTSGFKGACLIKGRWVGHIKKNGVRTYLGYFDTAEEAHAAYCEAAKVLHGEFARAR